VIMFFIAVAIDIFWIGRLVAGKFPSTLAIEDRVYNAFGAPDLILSILLYIGAYGLLRAPGSSSATRPDRPGEIAGDRSPVRS
jgi:hypothetical protein